MSRCARNSSIVPAEDIVLQVDISKHLNSEMHHVFLLYNVFIWQSATAELSDIRDELAASKKERSSLQAKLVQLTTALKSTLAAKVSANLRSFVCSACRW